MDQFWDERAEAPMEGVLLSEHGICYMLMTEEHKVAADPHAGVGG